jgi:DNA-binding NarL/FixJ family response regulator
MSFSLENVRAWSPAIILLDTYISGCTLSQELDRIRQEQPHIQWVVLADSVQQLQEAQAIGADAALLKGASAAELVRTIERLLACP